MADAAVEFLLSNLTQLLLYNRNLISGVRDQVESLHADLSLFKAFLRDSTENHRRQQHEVLKELVKQIRNVVYEAEDAVDSYVAQEALHSARNPLKRVFDYPARIRLAKEIEEIRNKVKDIYENRRYGFGLAQVGDGHNRRSPKQKKPPIVEEDNVVGFEDEAEKIIKLLTEGAAEPQAISIIGMPGLGKTTLAKMVYRDPKIGYNFHIRAWAYVSQDYSRREVFLSILSHIPSPTDSTSKMTDEQLAREIHCILEHSKYLIVLDDIWTEEAWNDLKSAFPRNKTGSRVLITSRKRKVAKHANPCSEPHNLRFLTHGESWLLLRRKALGSEECPEELVSDGLHIAGECKGLPLAVVVIGGILLEKGTDWWEKVARRVDAFFALDEQKRVESFVDMSYSDLPYHLKACFLYFGMFPEDHEISVWRLVKLWIAEGFVQQNLDMSLEDIGEEYLEDLVSRNLVMVGKFKPNGKIKTCQVHDVLREFCKKEAANENFFSEIRHVDFIHSIPSPSPERHRRLSIHSHLIDFISSIPQGQRVRSFLCFSTDEATLPAEHISTLPSSFKLLRVLDARSLIFPRFPTKLSQLVHLRFLVLSINIKVIPEAISSLWNLQTILFQTSSRTLDVKVDLLKLTQVRHVKTEASMSLPSPLSKSRKGKDDVRIIGTLQTLSMISPESCTDDVFSLAPNLKSLGIRGQLVKLLERRGSGSTQFDSLGKLIHLESLKLTNDAFPHPPSAMKLAELPRTYKFPPKLKKLTLSATLLDWKHMSTLGKLENLEILKLKDNAFEGEMWAVDEAFRALRVLQIERVNNLVNWHASGIHFPRLRSLFVSHCDRLAGIPLGLADISSLQKIDLSCTTASAAASGRRIQEVKMIGKGNGFKLNIFPPEPPV